MNIEPTALIIYYDLVSILKYSNVDNKTEKSIRQDLVGLGVVFISFQQGSESNGSKFFYVV